MRVYTVSTEMVTVALLITTCILGYFVMKICLAVIKAGERAIGAVQAPERNEQRDRRVEPRAATTSREALERNTGDQRDQREAQRAANTSREVQGINSIEIPPARTHSGNAYERRICSPMRPACERRTLIVHEASEMDTREQRSERTTADRRQSIFRQRPQEHDE